MERAGSGAAVLCSMPSSLVFEWSSALDVNRAVDGDDVPVISLVPLIALFPAPVHSEAVQVLVCPAGSAAVTAHPPF